MQTGYGRRTYVPGLGHRQIEFVSQPTCLLDKSTRETGLRVTLTVLAVGLFTAAISAAGGLAHAAVHRSSQAPKACVSKARHGRFGGVVRAVPVDAACFAHNTSDAANGTPPLLGTAAP
jgi:hypothetical protein